MQESIAHGKATYEGGRVLVTATSRPKVFPRRVLYFPGHPAVEKAR